MSLSPKALKMQLMIADGVAVLTGCAFAFGFQRVVKPVPRFVWMDHLTLLVMSLPFFAVGAIVARMYLARANERPSQEWTNIAKTVGVGVGGMVVLAFALQYKTLSRFWVFLVVSSVTVALIAEREIARRVFQRLRCAGRLVRRVVIVGTDAHAVALVHAFQRRPDLGYHVVGYVGDGDMGHRGGVGRLGGVDDLMRVLADHDATGVVVSLGGVDSDRANRLTRCLTDAGYHTALSTSLQDIDVARIRPQQADGQTILYVEPVVRTGWRLGAKRMFDIVLATAILMFSFPVLAIAAIAIKIDSRGPVVVRQRGVGQSGQEFNVLKLRTMWDDAASYATVVTSQSRPDSPLPSLDDDPRVTRVGRRLRRLSIDELPQLISVIRGDMSMVGPRPASPHDLDDWEPEAHDRLRVPPGLTGMWQVSGRSQTTVGEFMRYDLYYVDNWSLAHDLLICAKTVGVVLSGRGAS